MIEILAPAGDENSAYAAVNAGADAIYLGLPAFSARASAENFSFEKLSALIGYAHFFGVKIYVAMNTVIKQSELAAFVADACRVWNLGADALILQDAFLGKYLKSAYPKIKLHLSTQAGVCNAYGARFAKECGFDRVILARETKLEDIKKIAEIIETEVFIQGALCTCFSGQCYFSSFVGGNSGNRGRCKQPCRKLYSVDEKGYDSPAYRISLSDLSVGEDIKELLRAGVTSFKIEGRMRRPEYVSAAVDYYRRILGGEKADLSALKRTYNRGNYTKGLAFGQDKSFISSSVQGHLGEFVGTVKVANGKYICLSRVNFTNGDGFKILRGGVEVCGALYGGKAKDGFVLQTSKRLLSGDKVFVTTDTRLNGRLLSACRKEEIAVCARIVEGERLSVTLNGVEFTSSFIAGSAKTRPLTIEDFIRCFDKTDAYPFKISYENIEVSPSAFVPVGALNELRRNAYSGYFLQKSEMEAGRMEEVRPLPEFSRGGKCSRTAVISGDLRGLDCDIAILKPDCYSCDLKALTEGFSGEIYLYLPPFASGEEIEQLKPAIKQFAGIYCGSNYAITLARELGVKLFAGVGMNITNAFALSYGNFAYAALSKELSLREANELSRENVFYLTAGDLKLMDLIYCPFGKNCKVCERRALYTLTDGDGRKFALRRYKLSECRFELFNCVPLVSESADCGKLYDCTLCGAKRLLEAGAEPSALKARFGKYTKGHSENSVL